MKKPKQANMKEKVVTETGKRLAGARNATPETQQSMADKLGVTLQTYQNYEYGKRELRASTIIKICAILKCSPSWLLGNSDEGSTLSDDSELLAALIAKNDEIVEDDAKKERLSALLAAFDKLNDEGQQNVVNYATDLSGNVKYKLKVKSKSRSDNSVSGVA